MEGWEDRERYPYGLVGSRFLGAGLENERCASCPVVEAVGSSVLAGTDALWPVCVCASVRAFVCASMHAYSRIHIRMYIWIYIYVCMKLGTRYAATWTSAIHPHAAQVHKTIPAIVTHAQTHTQLAWTRPLRIDAETLQHARALARTCARSAAGQKFVPATMIRYFTIHDTPSPPHAPQKRAEISLTRTRTHIHNALSGNNTLRESFIRPPGQQPATHTYYVTSSYILCHIIIHTMSHHHTYYVTSSYTLCHIITHSNRTHRHTRMRTHARTYAHTCSSDSRGASRASSSVPWQSVRTGVRDMSCRRAKWSAACLRREAYLHAPQHVDLFSQVGNLLVVSRRRCRALRGWSK